MPTMPTPYQFDPTGTLTDNLITGEQHILTPTNSENQFLIVPTFGPFFADSVVLNFTAVSGESRELVEGIDYYPTHWFASATRACAKAIYGSLSILDTSLAGVVSLQYRTLGGDWTIDSAKIIEILADTLHNPRITTWEQVVNLPFQFPVINHQWDLVDMVGMSDLLAAFNRLIDATYKDHVDGLGAHLSVRNPHNVTPAMIGAYSKTEADEAILEKSGMFIYLNADKQQPLRVARDGKNYLINSLEGVVTLGLPANVSEGFAIKVTDAGMKLSVNPLTIVPADAPIAGQANFVINVDGGDYIVWFNGFEWLVNKIGTWTSVTNP